MLSAKRTLHTVFFMIILSSSLSNLMYGIKLRRNLYVDFQTTKQLR